MNCKTLISVCIPLYNGEEYLEKALESVSAQTYRNLEIIIVDDGSTDNSLSIVNNHLKGDSRIRLFKNQNRLGLAGNWNECIRCSNGEWIKFVFQDDFLAPDCIESMLEAIALSGKDVKVAFCRRKFIFDNPERLDFFDIEMRDRRFFWDIYPTKTQITPPETLQIVASWKARNVFGEPTSFLIHKKVFSKIGLFDENFHHIVDTEYWLRAAINFDFLFIPEELAFFRVHQGSATAFNRREKQLQMRYLDRVRLFKKFLVDDNFANLRLMTASWPSNLFLEAQISILMRRARLAVETHDDVGWMDAFNEFCRKNQDIVEIIDTSYLKMAVKYSISLLWIKISFFLDSLKNGPS